MSFGICRTNGKETGKDVRGMAGRKKQPVELLLLKGKTNLTKAEIAKRQAEEIHAAADQVTAPRFLTAAQRREFDRIAGQLIQIGIMSNLDCDALGFYIAARAEWAQAGRDYKKARRQFAGGDEEALDLMVKISGIQDRAFKQAIRCATELGLTITSRCKLSIPQAEEKPENKFARFG